MRASLFCAIGLGFAAGLTATQPRPVARTTCPHRRLPCAVWASATPATSSVPPAVPAAQPRQPNLQQYASSQANVLAPAISLMLIHSLLRITLQAVGIGFPPAMVGMLGGFGLLCGGHTFAPETVARITRFFEPACGFFRLWLAVIFAPGFICLPITMPPLGGVELALFFVLLAAGLVSTMASSALVASVLQPRAVRQAGVRPADSAGRIVPVKRPSPPAAASAVPFPASMQRALGVACAVCAATFLLVPSHPLLALNLCLLSTTVGSFAAANTLCPPKVKLWLHPFLTASACTLAACGGLGVASGVGWRPLLSAFGTGGAGAWLTSLMGPTVVSFAFQLFAFRAQLRARLGQILGIALISGSASMLTGVLAARALGLAPVLRVALASRTTTTALAGEISRLLGGVPAIGMLAAFATGILAIPSGKALLDKLRVTEPAARGLVLSSAAHGGAVLLLSDEPEAFPFAALMMNMNAACAVCLLSVPLVRRGLLAAAGLG